MANCFHAAVDFDPSASAPCERSWAMTALGSSSRRALSSSSSTAAPLYRLVYFNLRGAAEPIRYLLALAEVGYADHRYPMKATGKGFGVDDTFLRDKKAGHFSVNLSKLPVLHVLDEKGRIAAALGQSHAIARFLAEQHHLFGANPIHRAWIDGIYESVRDIRSAYMKTTRKGAKERQSWLEQDLPIQCQQLEASLPMHQSGSWLVGETPSLADVAVYSLLATPTSLVTGASESWFDGAEPAIVGKALRDCPRLASSVKEFGKLPSIQKWEESRPDTFQ